MIITPLVKKLPKQTKLSLRTIYLWRADLHFVYNQSRFTRPPQNYHEKKMNIRNFQVAHNFINPTFLWKGNQRNLTQLMQRKWQHKQFWVIPVVHQMNQSMMTVPLAKNIVISQMALIAINQSKPTPDAVVEVLLPLFEEICLVGGQYCYTPKKETSVCIMSYVAWLPQINLAICLRVLHFNQGFNATNTDLVGRLQGILHDLKRIKWLEDRREYTYG